MSNYTKTTNFTAKDSLSSGDPNKKIRGSEHDTEYDNIASMSATKANKVASPTSGNVAKLSGTGDLVDAGYAFSALSGSTAVLKADLDAITGIAALGIAPTEIGYLNGVTSNLQTQIDGKQPLDGDLTAIAAISTAAWGRGILAVASESAGRSYLGINGSGGVIGHGDLTPFATGTQGIGTTQFSRSTSSLSYVKLLEFTVPKSGTINTYIGLHGNGSGSGGAGYARVYKNGSPVGTERTNAASSTTYTYWSEDISVAVGDLIQLYVHADAFADTYTGIMFLRSSAATAMNCPETLLTYPST